MPRPLQLLITLTGFCFSVFCAAELPRIVSENGKHALFVDGSPYLILGAQANNSSNYPAALKDVWPTINSIHANTLEINVAWEQIEPIEGTFDFSYLDTLIKEARQHNVKLVLLWFATWKNNAPHYAPAWVKLNNERFPRVITENGKQLNSLSPIHASTLEADKKAFAALMTHLKKIDKKHTVIMVQVQNEPGTYGAARDYSKSANTLFNSEVPTQLRSAMHLPAGNWPDLFGADASEFFHAYHIARYCNEVAAAGKAVYPIPMNVNVALRNPFNPGKPGAYASGGATDNVLAIWQAAAPAIDMISPDIYFRDYATATKVIELYSGPSNPLFVAEIGNDQPYARYFFSALGAQAIGFAPFGMDTTGYSNFPLGAKTYDSSTFAPFAEIYRLMKPLEHKWAELSFTKDVWGVAEPTDTHQQNLDLGLWDAEVSYGRPMFWTDPPQGNTPPSGGALIAKLDDNEFLVTALRARVTFTPSSEIATKPYMLVRVEEGYFDKRGKWVFERVWNGDQTDWGLNFDDKPHLLKVKLSTY